MNDQPEVGTKAPESIKVEIPSPESFKETLANAKAEIKNQKVELVCQYIFTVMSEELLEFKLEFSSRISMLKKVRAKILEDNGFNVKLCKFKLESITAIKSVPVMEEK